MHGGNRTRPPLQHPVGCRSKHGQIPGPTTAHSHHRPIDLCLLGELNDVLVRFSDTHRRLDLERLAFLGWNQFIELGNGCR